MSRIRDLRKHRAAMLWNPGLIPMKDDEFSTAISEGHKMPVQRSGSTETPSGLKLRNYDGLSQMTFGNSSKWRAMHPASDCVLAKWSSRRQIYTQSKAGCSLARPRACSSPPAMPCQSTAMQRWRATKDQIQSLWKELFVVPEECAAFAAAHFSYFSLENLLILEQELDRLTHLAQFTRQVIQCIDQREAALESLIRCIALQDTMEQSQILHKVHQLRLKTVACVESLYQWRTLAGPGPEVMWEDGPYLHKMRKDMVMLAESPLSRTLSFQLQGNIILNPMRRNGPLDIKSDISKDVLDRMLFCETLLGHMQIERLANDAAAELIAPTPADPCSKPLKVCTDKPRDVPEVPEVAVTPPSSPFRSLCEMIQRPLSEELAGDGPSPCWSQQNSEAHSQIYVPPNEESSLRCDHTDAEVTVPVEGRQFETDDPFPSQKDHTALPDTPPLLVSVYCWDFKLFPDFTLHQRRLPNIAFRKQNRAQRMCGIRGQNMTKVCPCEPGHLFGITWLHSQRKHRTSGADLKAIHPRVRKGKCFLCATTCSGKLAASLCSPSACPASGGSPACKSNPPSHVVQAFAQESLVMKLQCAVRQWLARRCAAQKWQDRLQLENLELDRWIYETRSGAATEVQRWWRRRHRCLTKVINDMTGNEEAVLHSCGLEEMEPAPSEWSPSSSSEVFTSASGCRKQRLQLENPLCQPTSVNN